MKTPNTITLIYGDDLVPEYNWETGEYEETGEAFEVQVPCLFNFISQEQQFRSYGSKQEKMAIVRFMQEQDPFTHARYKGDLYKPYDAIDAPVKGAVRLVRVVE